MDDSPWTRVKHRWIYMNIYSKKKMSGSDYTTEKSEHITEKTECRLSLYN